MEIDNRHKLELYDNGVPVGETWYNLEPKDNFFGKQYLSIYDLFVNEEYRRKGYATKLLDRVIDIAENLRIDTISLIVDKNNKEAVRLYFKHGFEIYQDHKERYCLVFNKVWNNQGV